MYSVCLSDLKLTAWSHRLRNIIQKSLEKEPNKFIIDRVD